MKEEHLDGLSLGSEVFNPSTGTYLGYISNIQSEQARYFKNTPDENGNIPVYTYSDIYDVYITVICDDAQIDETGFCNIGSTRILVGSQIYFSSGYLNRVGYCTRFEIKNNG